MSVRMEGEQRTEAFADLQKPLARSSSRGLAVARARLAANRPKRMIAIVLILKDFFLIAQICEETR